MFFSKSANINLYSEGVVLLSCEKGDNGQMRDDALFTVQTTEGPGCTAGQLLFTKTGHVRAHFNGDHRIKHRERQRFYRYKRSCLHANAMLVLEECRRRASA
jgi:hypothetical protein